MMSAMRWRLAASVFERDTSRACSLAVHCDILHFLRSKRTRHHRQDERSVKDKASNQSKNDSIMPEREHTRYVSLS